LRASPSTRDARSEEIAIPTSSQFWVSVASALDGR
jgi:hypothetical protein